MQEKAPQKLSHMQSHEALLVFMSGVTPAEGHLIVGERDESVIRDGDSVCVAAQIAESMLRAAKGSLGIDNPFLMSNATLNGSGTLLVQVGIPRNQEVPCLQRDRDGAISLC
jgi:hypothetical protein